jgi:3-phenylpropionate/trans-cinnamate dioxygenase ferredoxin subunit
MSVTRRYAVCSADELATGQRRVVSCGRLRVCVFNVDGTLEALLDRCPHQAAPLSSGVVSGSPVARANDAPGVLDYEPHARFLRCPWHGWEYDLRSGRALAEPRIRVRKYRVSVESGEIVVYV